jgi:hypothetical protein
VCGRILFSKCQLQRIRSLSWYALCPPFDRCCCVLCLIYNLYFVMFLSCALFFFFFPILGKASTVPPAYVLFNPLIWLFWLIDIIVWLFLPFPGLGLLKMFASVCYSLFVPLVRQLEVFFSFLFLHLCSSLFLSCISLC